MMRQSSVFLSVVSLTLVSIAACGGDSKSFTSPSSGGSAGSGSGSGGSSGKGGASGSGGSSAAGGTTGGSAGKGGSSGKGGSAGTGTGGATGGASGSGQSGEGGDATGGTSMAGTAGVGAMTGYDPPDTQVDACTSTCAAAAAAECPNADPEAQCVADCQFAIRIEACTDYWDALFACQETAQVECNTEGEPTWPGCEDEYIAALDCVFNDALDPDLEVPCGNLCEAQQSVMCDNSQPVADCTTDCQIIGTAVPVCKAQLTGYLGCAAEAEEFTCDADGDPQPAGCVGPSLSLLACVVTEYDITL